MDIFGNSEKMRGCFTMFNYGLTNKRGFFLRLPDSSDMEAEGIIVTGVGFVAAEKFLVVPCFNNITHTYGFGHDASSSIISVDFLGFLITPNGRDQSDVIGFMSNSYATGRLSQSKQQAELYCGTNPPLRGFMIRLESNTANLESNIQGFRIQLLMVEPQCADR